MRREHIFIQTKRKIIAMSLSIVIGTLMVFALITQQFYLKMLFKSVDQQLYTHKNMVMQNAHIRYEGDKVIEIVLPAPLVKELISYVWQKDVLVKDSPYPYEGEEKYPVFKEDWRTSTVHMLVDGQHYYRGIEFYLKDCKIQLLLSVDEQMASLASLRKALMSSLICLILVTLLLAAYLANIALKPLYLAYEKMEGFIQAAAHEMRTPLTVIKGKIELLAAKGKEPIEAHYQELGSVMKEITGLTQLNKDLLLLSKEDIHSELSVKPVSLNSLLQEICDLYGEMAEYAGIQFELTVPKESPMVIWDAEKVKRCLIILLENAIKYTPAHGKINLTVKKQEKKILLSLKDTGYGIREEEIPYIFDRFYRSKEMRGRQIEGSGLGLSLLKAQAKTMRVKIKVHSVYGKGTEFILELPIKMK